MRHYNIMILNTDDDMVKMHHQKGFGVWDSLLATKFMQDEEHPEEKYRIISIEEVIQ